MRTWIVSNHNIFSGELSRCNYKVDCNTFYNIEDIIKDPNIRYNTKYRMLTNYVFSRDELRIFEGRIMLKLLQLLMYKHYNKNLSLIYYLVLTKMFRIPENNFIKRLAQIRLEASNLDSSIKCTFDIFLNDGLFCLHILLRFGFLLNYNDLMSLLIVNMYKFKSTELTKVDYMGITRSTFEAKKIDPDNWKL